MAEKPTIIVLNNLKEFKRLYDEYLSSKFNEQTIFRYKGILESPESLNLIKSKNIGDIYWIKSISCYYVYNTNGTIGWWSKFGGSSDGLTFSDFMAGNGINIEKVTDSSEEEKVVISADAALDGDIENLFKL